MRLASDNPQEEFKMPTNRKAADELIEKLAGEAYER
jgi:hypothetical protein